MKPLRPSRAAVRSRSLGPALSLLSMGVEGEQGAQGAWREVRVGFVCLLYGGYSGCKGQKREGAGGNSCVWPSQGPQPHQSVAPPPHPNPHAHHPCTSSQSHAPEQGLVPQEGKNIMQPTSFV